MLAESCPGTKTHKKRGEAREGRNKPSIVKYMDNRGQTDRLLLRATVEAAWENIHATTAMHPRGERSGAIKNHEGMIAMRRSDRNAT